MINNPVTGEVYLFNSGEHVNDSIIWYRCCTYHGKMKNQPVNNLRGKDKKPADILSKLILKWMEENTFKSFFIILCVEFIL